MTPPAEDLTEEYFSNRNFEEQKMNVKIWGFFKYFFSCQMCLFEDFLEIQETSNVSHSPSFKNCSLFAFQQRESEK